MGMFDTILLIDESDRAACADGHRVRSLQTKDLSDPSMRTCLVHRGRLLLAARLESGDDDAGAWRIDGSEAVHALRYGLTELPGLRSLRAYTSCPDCPPVLVRTDGAGWGGLVAEHQPFVDFTFIFRPSEPLQIERTSGSRDDFRAELRARGLCVLNDDESLAIAHLELRAARERRGLPIY